MSSGVKRHAHVVFVRMENKEARFARYWEEAFGRRVRELRSARGWTQGDLAERMTVAGYQMHQSTVAKLENGSRPTNVGEIAALAAIFGMPIGHVFSNDLDTDSGTAAAMARLFDRWESARQASLRADSIRHEAFEALAQFVQENHKETLEPFFERVRAWADFEADAKSDAEADVLHAMVVARAVPVKPFKDMEDEAVDRLIEERRAAGLDEVTGEAAEASNGKRQEET